MQKVGTAVAEQTTKKAKEYVTGGPHLWISTLLYHRGTLSGNRIWDEFVRDNKVDKDILRSKSHLKRKILPRMYSEGKI